MDMCFCFCTRKHEGPGLVHSLPRVAFKLLKSFKSHPENTFERSRLLGNYRFCAVLKNFTIGMMVAHNFARYRSFAELKK